MRKILNESFVKRLMYFIVILDCDCNLDVENEKNVSLRTDPGSMDLI